MPRAPDNTNRLVEIGRTGTGKTVVGLWHLTNYPIDVEPWVILNLKGDEHIEGIPNARFLPDLSYVPGKKDRGVFVVSPSIYDLEGSLKEDSALDQYLLKLWEREKIGIFVDEGFMLGRSKPFILNLTQGRSKRIPMIVCTQKPKWITGFVFSEASFIQVFDLNDDKDIQRVEEFVPIDWDSEPPLKPHQSFYYEVATNEIVRFNPCPPMKDINKVFAEKLYRNWVAV